MEQLARDGMEKLSLRSLAASRILRRTALYRYFASRSQTGSCDHAEITEHVHEGLRKAAGRKAPEQRFARWVRAYIRFAHEQKHFYDVFLRPCAETPEGEAAHTALWNFVLEQVGRISGPKKAPEAAIALWALLHGFVGLASAGVFDRGKPRSALIGACKRGSGLRGARCGYAPRHATRNRRERARLCRACFPSVIACEYSATLVMTWSENGSRP